MGVCVTWVEEGSQCTVCLKPWSGPLKQLTIAKFNKYLLLTVCP